MSLSTCESMLIIVKGILSLVIFSLHHVKVFPHDILIYLQLIHESSVLEHSPRNSDFIFDCHYWVEREVPRSELIDVYLTQLKQLLCPHNWKREGSRSAKRSTDPIFRLTSKTIWRTWVHLRETALLCDTLLKLWDERLHSWLELTKIKYASYMLNMYWYEVPPPSHLT